MDDFMLQHTPIVQNNAASRPLTHEKRKERIIKRIYDLPLTKYYSEETVSAWSLSRLHKELKVNNIIPKGQERKDLEAELIRSNCQTSLTACCICCEDYETGDVLRALGCTHEFHVECIDKWAISATDYSKPPECPICKAQI